MIWHYDEAEAGRVGHPWLGDPAWNEENGSGFVTKLGEFVALLLIGGVAGGVGWLWELGEFTLLLLVAGLVGIGWVVVGTWGWVMWIVTGRRVKG